MLVVDAYRLNGRGDGIITTFGPGSQELRISDGKGVFVYAEDACQQVRTTRQMILSAGWALSIYEPPPGCN